MHDISHDFVVLPGTSVIGKPVDVGRDAVGAVVVEHAIEAGPAITISGPGEVSAQSVGSGQAGTLDLSARRGIHLRDGGSVNVSAGFADPRDLQPGETLGPPQLASAGRLTLRAPRIELRDNAEIAAQATGDSGIVRVSGSGFTRVSRSTIVAEAGREGGVIALASDAVVLDRSRIEGSAFGGEDVAVTISAAGLIQFQSIIETDNLVLPPEVDIAGSLARLPGSLADPNLRLIDACAMRVAEASISPHVASMRLNPSLGGALGINARLVRSVGVAPGVVVLSDCSSSLLSRFKVPGPSYSSRGISLPAVSTNSSFSG